ncbi:hypothetical protein [Pseudonocardia lacus]|uniref:hypothetical protein n=1 Tax=Pseudonocardia lacus TaxID=2835865 RepID=UPI002027E6BE|nr:hypothetical protein [Pseudonocardia lacus]
MTDGPQPADRPEQTAPDAATDGEVVDAEVVSPVPALPSEVPAPPPSFDYDERGVPTLDYVRDKIEGRYATGIGAAELTGESAAGRTIEQQEAERADKAKAKLDEIRRSLGL